MNEAKTEQGLYDPRFEHDACGIAFVASSGRAQPRGRRSPSPRWRTSPTGRLRCRPGDRATVPASLVQMPDRFYREDRRLSTLPDPSVRTRAGIAFLPRDGAGAEALKAEIEPSPPTRAWPCFRGGGPVELGRRRRDGGSWPRASGRSSSASDPAGPTGTRAWRSTACVYVLRKRAEHEIADVLLPLALGADHRLQGHAHLGAARRVLPRPGRPALRVGLGTGPLPVLDQHLPVAGRSPTRTGSSPTTARSTRCRATGTGCGPARRCWQPT